MSPNNIQIRSLRHSLSRFHVLKFLEEINSELRTNKHGAEPNMLPNFENSEI